MRIAYFNVDTVLFDSWAPGLRAKAIDYEKYPEVLAEIGKAFKLPANATVEAVSPFFRFLHNQVTIRVVCEDFVDTKEGNCIPEVEPFYNERGFSHWGGVHEGMLQEHSVKQISETVERFCSQNDVPIFADEPTVVQG